MSNNNSGHKCNCLYKAPIRVEGDSNAVYHEACDGFIDSVDNLNLNLPFWNSQVGEAGGIVIDGTHYRVGEVPYPSKGDGMSGRRFRIKMLETGEKIDTRDLWSQGTVPEEYRGLLQDNAEFIKMIELKQVKKCHNENCKYNGHVPALINIMDGARGACAFCYKKAGAKQLKVRIA